MPGWFCQNRLLLFFPATALLQNWPTCNKALKRRGSLTVWFDAEMTWAAKPA